MGVRLVRVRVPGGKATPEPPLGPALQQFGLNVEEVVNKLNELTKHFEGMEVTVDIYVDPETKEYFIEVKSPPTSELLIKAAGASKPSGDPEHQKVGDVSLEDVVKIALMKKKQLTAKTLKAAVKTILSTAQTVGVTVNGKEPRDVLKEVEQGLHDELLLKYEEEWRKEE